METKKTFCRICEALCGLEVDVEPETGRVMKIRPDKTHPVSKGYACAKGVRFAELHDDPRRLNHPMKKVDGRFERISWAQAIEEIGAKTRAIVRRRGRRSVGLYTGNPTFFNLGAILFAHEFAKAMGSPNHFASHSVDVNNKLFVAQQVYGRSLVHPVPDFERTNFLLCLGSNPMVSQMSVVSAPNAIGRLQAIEARGGRVVIVDPRRTETADKVGEHLFIAPGSDVYLLLAILHVLGRERPAAAERLESVAHGAEAFLALGKGWPPTRAAALTGLDAAVIERLATDYLNADGACLYMSTGLNMGPFGSACYWLIQGLSLLSGNLDRSGGMIFREGPYDGPKLWKKMGVGGESPDRTLKDGWSKVAGAFPVAALADEIEIDHPERIRALFITAGNPAHSVPGGGVKRALDRLDLLVCVDIFRNETSERADYLLPATDMLERSDFPMSWMELQAEPWAQYTDAMTKPLYERRQEWEIFSDLARACGAKAFGETPLNLIPRLNRLLATLPGDRRIKPDTLLAVLLKGGGQVTLPALKGELQGVAVEQPAPGAYLGRRVPTDDHRMQLAPGSLAAEAERIERYAADNASAPQGKLRLIGRRERRTHNSWYKDRARDAGNVAIISPEDARARNIGDDDRVLVSADGLGAIELPVRVSDEVMPGVLVVPHGWGEAAGVNVNQIIPGGTAQMERCSGQSIILSHPVSVDRAEAAALKQDLERV